MVKRPHNRSWIWRVMMSDFIFQSTNNRFSTKTGFLNHLKVIRNTADNNQNGMVLDKNHILELKDFLRDYYIDRDIILSEYDLDNCEFFVALPPTVRNNHKCIWIKDKVTDKTRHFATTKNGLVEPTPFGNFYNFCTNELIPIKREIRRYITNELGLSLDDFDLWHKSPKTKELVEEFIAIKDIGDKLNEIISPNGSGFNVPVLNPKYEYLKQEFINFYQSKVATELFFELKLRK